MRHLPAGSPARAAFSLIELLVVIAIVGILVALLLAAVQVAREAASRVKCANNIHQMIVACHLYHDSNQTFPRTYGTDFSGGKMVRESWLLSICPYMEQDNVYSLVYDAGNSVPITTPVMTPFVCPSDPRGPLTGSAYYGLWHNITATKTCYCAIVGDDIDDDRGVWGLGVEEISAGSSNTIVIGERPPPGDDPGWDGLGNGGGFTAPSIWPEADVCIGTNNLYTEFQNPDPASPSRKMAQYANFGLGSYEIGPHPFSKPIYDYYWDANHLYSFHTNGANFAFADGSVRFLPYRLSEVVISLAHRNRDPGDYVSAGDSN